MGRATKLPLLEIYQRLFAHFGPQHWWPGRTRFEICVGAILTQNAAWKNVERAIANLRRAGKLSPRAMRVLPQRRMAELIRSSGYFRVKAQRLRAFVEFLWRETRGDLRRLLRQQTVMLRKKLLSVHGIGPETADSILLYAGDHPIFVVDGYTRRVMARHGWGRPDAGYEELQETFHWAFPHRPVKFFNESHALFVAVGKNYCRRRAPRCEECPLRPLLPRGGPLELTR